MAADRPQKTLADYLIIAINPALIMTLVGSLVFFLADVLYSGQYGGRLNWTLFWFVFGAVLIARLTVEGVGHASLYGLVLGVIVWLSLTKFVEYAPGGPFASFSWAINLLLIGVIWFSAYKLTQNCTVIEDHEDARGAGLLDAAGLEPGVQRSAESGVRSSASGVEAESGVQSSESGVEAQLQTRDSRKTPDSRLQTRDSRKVAPGVWVIYFSLAALPLFALGQSLMPAEDAARRRYAFWLMGLYVASGLGLLLTTSFLALRRYLRQRKLQMPVAMTGTWLAVGGGLALALIVAATVLPRPYAEYSLAKLTGLAGSQDQKASKKAILRDNPGKGQGRAANDPKARDDNAQKGQGAQRDKEGDRAAQGKQGEGNKGKPAAGNQKQGQQGNAKDKGKNQDQAKGNQDEQNKDQQGEKQDEQGDEGNEGDKAEEEDTAESSNWFEQFHASGVMTVVKWLVYAAVILAGLYLLLRFLANFSGWASRLLALLRAFFEGLFGKRAESAEEAEAEAAPAAAPPRPFAEFSDPFLDGRADRLSPSALVRYSFEALEAWAFERDLPRLQEETPIEFARRLGDELPALEEDARQLSGLYAHVAYARVPLTPASVAPLRQFWQQLRAIDTRPLSAATTPA